MGEPRPPAIVDTTLAPSADAPPPQPPNAPRLIPQPWLRNCLRFGHHGLSPQHSVPCAWPYDSLPSTTLYLIARYADGQVTNYHLPSTPAGFRYWAGLNRDRNDEHGAEILAGPC
jgi:hypothetical protein